MPSSPGYKRDYKQEYATESSARRKYRALRNKARRRLMKIGLVKKGDDKHVDHQTPLSMGGNNSRKNLRVRSASDNSSYKRTSKGKMRYKSQK